MKIWRRSGSRERASFFRRVSTSLWLAGLIWALEQSVCQKEKRRASRLSAFRYFLTALLLLLAGARRGGRRSLLGLLLGGRAARGRAAASHGGAGRARAGRGRRLAGRPACRRAAHAERGERVLVELTVRVQALLLLRVLQRFLRLRSHDAGSRHVQLLLNLLDGLGVMLLAAAGRGGTAIRLALRLTARRRARCGGAALRGLVARRAGRRRAGAAGRRTGSAFIAARSAARRAAGRRGAGARAAGRRRRLGAARTRRARAARRAARALRLAH